MCGIVGRMNAERSRRVDPDQLADALARLAHRGPDGDGLFLEENVGLGHRRLAIVDLSGGAQPMANEDRSVWVIFNGEIYNHALLREELIGHGHTFTTRSDTEVLVHGYEQWGERLPERLRGMFAFAIWDGPRRTLLIARDRLGIKPIYWARAGSDLVFASEIKALLAFRDVRCAVDEERIPEYFALRYVPGPETIFAGVRRLQPGHLLVCKDGAVRVRRYWDVPLEAARTAPKKRDAIEEAEALRVGLLESVRLRLMADVPVGVFLSGGIDSTAVAWAMRAGRPAALKSFSVGFEGDSEGELAYARVAANALGTEHREVLVDAAGFLDSLERLVWHLDEPLADGACVPLMHLAKRAREEVVVVLSGEGADEVLGGYPIYRRQLAIEAARARGGRLLDVALGAARLGARAPKLRRYLEMARKPMEARYFGVGRAFDDALLAEHFGPTALERLAGRFEPLWRASSGLDGLHRMLYADTKVWLPDDLLIKADKTTMAHSIELRVPFLDHELLEACWSLPADLKLHRGVGKRLLRMAVGAHVPKSILHRPKRGFPVPLTRWLRGPLHDPCRDVLLAQRSAVGSVFGRRAIEGLLEQHRSGAVDRREELYALWVFEHWHQAFLATRGAGRTQAPYTLARASAATPLQAMQ